jgi:hypothetical protein
MPTNPVPKVVKQNPEQGLIDMPRIANPYLGVWWSTQTVSDVPENVMGWLVAQGFEVTNIRQDTTTNPPTNYFSVKKEGLRPKDILLSLCNSYTIAANDARDVNEFRYNQILANMTEMVDTSHEQFDLQVAEQNIQTAVYLADLDTYMTNIETMISDNQSQIVTDAEEAKAALGEMLDRLSDLETNATNNAFAIGTLLTQQTTNLTSFVNDYDSKLAELDQNFAAYLGDVLSQVSSLGTVLDSHVSDYNQQFAVLADDYFDHATDIASQLANVPTNTNTYVADVAAILTLLESDYLQVQIDLDSLKNGAGELVDQYAGDYDTILDRLETDYTAHVGLARGFLVGLGKTETKRINEQFNASLSSQMQMLVSRGLFMSTVPVDVTARNIRDRDENIQLLNDRLSRENLDNQHKLYEQQANMRARKLDGMDRMHSVQQEVLRYKASLVSSTYGLLSDARNRILAGKQAIFSAKDATHKYGIEVTNSLYAKLQDIRQRTIDSVDRVHQLRDIFAKWKENETVKRYEQLQQIEAQFLESIQRQQAARQDVTKN